MVTLTDEQILRQDYVDKHIFQLFQTLNPTQHPIEWDIEIIGDIRDAVEYWMATKLKICTEKDFYPYIEEENGNQRNSN
jgi:hypothetical protein